MRRKLYRFLLNSPAMPVPLLALALFACSAIYAAFFVRGLATGKASDRYQKNVDRMTDPVRFWGVQSFNAIFALAAAGGGIVALTYL